MKKRRVKIVHKLLGSFLLISGLISLIGGISVVLSRDILSESIGNDTKLLVKETIDKVNRSVQKHLEQTQIYARVLAKDKYLISANQKRATQKDPKRKILEEDKIWRSKPLSEITPFMAELIGNPLSEKLRNEFELKEFHKKNYGYPVFSEVFVTDQFGANVAQTGKTSDYYQADERWWKETKDKCLFVGDVEFDESGGVYFIDIAVRLNDQNSRFLGVVKAVLNIAETRKIIDKAIKQLPCHPTSVDLLSNNGEFIFRLDNGQKQDTQIKIDGSLLKEVTANDGYFFKSIRGKRLLFAYVKSSGHRDFNPNWTFIVSFDTAEVMAPVSRMTNILIAAAAAIMILGALLAWFLAKSLVRPIVKLRTAATALGEGDLHAHVEEVKSNDELSDLAKVFNDMADHLREVNNNIQERNLELQKTNQDLIDLNKAHIELENSLQTQVDEQTKDLRGAKTELENKVHDLERFQRVTLNREQQMITLKKEVNQILINSNQAPKYDTNSNCELHNIEQAILIEKALVEKFSNEEDSPELRKELIEAYEELQETQSATLNIMDDLKSQKDELEQANQKLLLNQSQLLQSEKMAAIGQIAAGVAHEINNPVGFVLSNLGTMTEYVEVIKKLLEDYDNLFEMPSVTDKGRREEIMERIERLKKEEDLEYILSDIDQLLGESKDGAVRVRDIVQNLKSFARADETEEKEADLNEGIEASLKIVWNELKYKCEVVKDLKPLPSVKCNPGQLNQVFMNLLVNASHAIQEKGEINIKTWAEKEEVFVRISDSGSGIAPENLSKLFDPFFTTKEVGKGTGLGLSISHGIIEKHGGTIEVSSKIGEGTTFTISLPVSSYNKEGGDTLGK